MDTTDGGIPVSDGALPSPRFPIEDALRSAGLWALVTLGLCFPIVAFETLQDFSNRLTIEARPLLVLFAVAAVFAGRLGWLAVRHHGLPQLLPATRFELTPERKKQLPRIGLAALLIFPFFALLLTGQGGAVKWIDNFGVQILIYVMLAWGLNIVVGLAGLLDLGYVAFYAVGAYAYALIATYVIPATVPGLGPWAFWICLPIAGILAAFWGILLGFPVLRLRGDYLAIVTLAFGEIIRLVLINWVEVTNGNAGIRTPYITFFGLPFSSRTGETTFGDVFSLPGSPAVHRSMFLYYTILALALLVAVATQRLRRLPIGRAWEAMREDEIACRSLGINTVNTKLTAFAIGAMFGGLAGAFFGARQGFVNPRSFEFMESATILAIVVLGGMGSLVGVAIAAVAVIGGIELLRELTFLKQIFGPEFDPGQYRMLIFGLAMVLMMIWRPRGLVGARQPTIALDGNAKAISASHVKEGHG
ncbi:Branched-chain amino acid transport system permease protein LivM [Hyphomicrobium sulfonivorans]|uniref:Branched-chain amino acid transport system permease protein LivM n=1 Tax=Hyphomicrobium sulfonivorans TaxID=121290 RepID=A0A120CUV0_HYPSL|nr:high-affinity branched-chain amino acid ABC transporter permease LivM [Hyphomicrobium sulfonivorans]KWT66794.1 Branched-chain amino acid transport system permease protein LivM [Hyphomicrobium sulfonivorans]